MVAGLLVSGALVWWLLVFGLWRSRLVVGFVGLRRSRLVAFGLWRFRLVVGFVGLWRSRFVVAVGVFSCFLVGATLGEEQEVFS